MIYKMLHILWRQDSWHLSKEWCWRISKSLANRCQNWNCQDSTLSIWMESMGTFVSYCHWYPATSCVFGDPRWPAMTLRHWSTVSTPMWHNSGWEIIWLWISPPCPSTMGGVSVNMWSVGMTATPGTKVQWPHGPTGMVGRSRMIQASNILWSQEMKCFNQDCPFVNYIVSHHWHQNETGQSYTVSVIIHF